MLVCIVDDVLENARFMERALPPGFEAVVFSVPHDAISHCRKNDVDIIIADQKMPDLSGIDLIRKIREHNDDTIAVVVSAYTDSDDLIEAVNSNTVFRYVVKPFSLETFRETVMDAAASLEAGRRSRDIEMQLIEQNRLLTDENRYLRAGVQPILDLFSGVNDRMKKLKDLALTSALTDEPVLITGETGTGKELLSRFVHGFSRRREKPFVPLNCAAVGESLFESTLFGYRKGAFTGADSDKKGLVGEADGGTLFLDEIGDLPFSMQPKLLRFLQNGTYLPVGGTKEQHSDVRIISATNRDPGELVQEGLFRKDVLYRLNTFHLPIPPLRDRREDIPHIINRIARARGLRIPPFEPDAELLLLNHGFPGNVRELESLLIRLSLQAHQRNLALLDVSTIHAVLSGTTAQASVDDIISLLQLEHSTDLHEIVARVERYVLERILREENGNISKSAKRLNLSRQGLRNKIAGYGINGYSDE